MDATESQKQVEIFDRSRKRLFGIAYRMLGTRDDAEDILQEAYIRWHKADADEIETPEAWLVTVVTRLSIDRQRKVSAERETYIGPWLPEPLIIDPARDPSRNRFGRFHCIYGFARTPFSAGTSSIPAA
jgi:DNA-directed RNA polymerase specialized sigma24 family protein